MKIHVNPEDCKFIVKPEDRKVICIYYTRKLLAFDYMFYNFDSIWCTGASDEMKKMNSYYSGIATCAPEDEWDEALGRKIAFYKMKKKFYTAFFKRINKYFEYMDKALDKAAMQCNQMGNKWEMEIADLEAKIEEKLKG